MRIKIKQNTPFHLAGTLLQEQSFKDIYPAFKHSNFQYAGNKIFQTNIKAANPEGQCFNYDYWFEVVEELMFGESPVEILKVYTNEHEIQIKCRSQYFKYRELLDWYYHFCHVITGFASVDYKSHNSDKVRFEGFSLKRHMMPEKCFIGGAKPKNDVCGHLTNTAEQNQKMDDVLNFPLGKYTDLNEVGIKIGCTTGTLKQLIEILNECKKINNEKGNVCM